jgi:hypothetical protein
MKLLKRHRDDEPSEHPARDVACPCRSTRRKCAVCDHRPARRCGAGGLSRRAAQALNWVPLSAKTDRSDGERVVQRGGCTRPRRSSRAASSVATAAAESRRRMDYGVAHRPIRHRQCIASRLTSVMRRVVHLRSPDRARRRSGRPAARSLRGKAQGGQAARTQSRAWPSARVPGHGSRRPPAPRRARTRRGRARPRRRLRHRRTRAAALRGRGPTPP